MGQSKRYQVLQNAKKQAEERNNTGWRAVLKSYAPKIIEASGIDKMQEDVFSLLDEGQRYFGGSGNSRAYLKKLRQMRFAIGKERQYFANNAGFFSADELKKYNGALDAWETKLSSYESAISSGAQARSWLNQKNMVFERAAQPQGQNFRAESKDAALLGMGSGLGKSARAVQETTQKWSKAGYAPTSKERQGFDQQIKALSGELEYAEYYYGQNRQHFTPEEQKQQEAQFAQVRSLLDDARRYSGTATSVNPLTGKPMPITLPTAIDIGADERADLMYHGGEFGRFMAERSAQKHDSHIEQYEERVDFASQDAGQFQSKYNENLAVAQGKGGTFIDRTQQDGNRQVFYMGQRGEDSVSETSKEASMQEAVKRLWHAAYTHNVDRDTFEQMVDALYDSPLAEKYKEMLPEKKEHFLYEYKLNYGITREALPYKSTQDLMKYAQRLVNGKANLADEKNALLYESVIAYLANKEMTQEERNQLLLLLTHAKENSGEDQAIDFDKYIQQRTKNGIEGNENGLKAALDIYPEFDAGTYLEMFDIGTEQAGENVFMKYSGVADEWLHDATGTAYSALGVIANGGGLFNNDVGNWLLDIGEKHMNYESDSRKEAEFSEYVRNRDASDLLKNGGKTEQWIGNMLRQTGTAITEMMAAGAVGAGATSSLPNMMLAEGAFSAAPAWALPGTAGNANTFLNLAKNASNLTMSAFAAANQYSQSKGLDTDAQTFIKTIGAGVTEYYTNGLFGGNELIDPAGPGKVAKWFGKITQNETFQKLMDSKVLNALKPVGKFVGDSMGEGMEEAASAIGNAALEYALTGESELTLDQLGEEFAVGMFVSMIMSAGGAAGEAIGRSANYVKVATFSDFDHSARKNLESLNTQMSKYAIEYLGGDSELMRANGWDDQQIAKAQKQWKRIVNEYNTAFGDMAQKDKIHAGDSARPSAQALIDSAKGQFGDVSAQDFTPATIKDDIDAIAEAYDTMEDSASDPNAALPICAEVAKMAQVAKQTVETAFEEGTIGQLQHENFIQVLDAIYNDATQAMDQYLTAVYGESVADSTAVNDDPATFTTEEMQKNADGFTQARNAQSPASTPEASLASQPSDESSIAHENLTVNELMRQYQNPQKNMTAEPSEESGGTGNAEVFDDRSQWETGLGSGGQVGTVAERTAGPVTRSETVTQATVISNVKKNATAQSARSIGVENGSDNATLYVLRDEDIAQSEQWRSIKADAEADGAKVVMFAGDLQVYNRSTKRFARVEGIHQTDEYGNTTYYVKVDKRSRGAKQIYRHEKFHEIVRANPGILGDLVRALEARYGQQEIASLLSGYIDDYGGIYGRFDESMSIDEQDDLAMQYLEEAFADVYAGISRGGVNTARAKRIMESQTTELQRAAQNRRAMRNKNAPPEQKFMIVNNVGKIKKEENMPSGNIISAIGSKADMSSSGLMVTSNAPKVKQDFSADDVETMDAQYLEAVERGDMDAVQRMVDEAAKRAGYTIHAYHGTPNGNFNVFKEWQYFTGNKEYADIYQNQGASSNGYKQTKVAPKTYDVYLKANKPFDTRNAEERDIFYEEFYRQWGNGAPLSERGLPDWTDGDDLVEFFEEKNYDYDAIYLDEGGTGGYGNTVQDRGISIAIKDSSQIKSAEPVTYDDDGKVIPLSERFNEGKVDIRYSLEDDAELDTRAMQNKNAPPEQRSSYVGERVPIVRDMPDAERFAILKNRTIPLVAKINNEAFRNFDERTAYYAENPEMLTETERKKLFRKIGEEFGVFKKYKNVDVKLGFNFSKGNVRESVSKQRKNYADLSKLLSCFDEVIEVAVGVEVHNRNEDGYKIDPTLKDMYVLVSAFEDGDDIVPVKLEVKEFFDKDNSLYVAVALERIKKDEVVKQGNTEDGVTQNSRSSTIRLADLFSKINPSDKQFLKYIPDGFLSGRQLMAKRDAMRKKSVSNKETGNIQGFSIDDDVAELDEQFGRRMAEDDTPEGLAPDDDQIKDYHALAREEKERRARVATVNRLQNRIKASQEAISAHRAAKTALKNIGGLTRQAAAALDEKVKLIQETLRIDQEALKQKRAAEEKHKKQERKEKEEAAIREQKAKTAQKELRTDLLNLFSVKPGVRFEIAQKIDQFSDELIRSGRLTNESRRELLEILYDHGEELVEADGFYKDIRAEVRNGRVYVSDSVRTEFGDDWENFRKRAWGNRIYLTGDKNDIGIDVWTDILADAFGGTFDATADLRSQLETIVDLAEEGKDEKLTIAEMMQRNQDTYGWSVEDQMDDLERKVDQMLETFAQKADLEIRLRRESVKRLLDDHAYFKQKIEANRAARMENQARNQVMRGIEKLSKMRRRAAPEYQKQIDEVLKDIDAVARSISARGLEDLQELQRLYLEAKEAEGDNFLSSPYVEARLGRLSKVQLDNMSIEDVRELGRMVSSIANAIKNSKKLLSDMYNESIETVAEAVDQEIASSKGGKMNAFLVGHLDAKRFFGKVSGWKNGAFEALGRNLSKGQERSQQYQLGAMRIFDDFLADKENQRWLQTATGKKAQWIEVATPNGIEISEGNVSVKVETVRITPMMRVSLLLHSKNEDNLRHIRTGGIRIPDAALYKKGKMKEAFARGKIIKMEPATVRAIVRECTQQEKAFAKLLEQYFNDYSKNAINEVSMLLDGFERAGGEHYYHIKTDPTFLAKQNEAVKRDLSVQAIGSIVNERLHASNPIVLEDATAALTEHIDNISKYYGFAVPLRDLNAVLSHNFHKEGMAFSGSVMNTISVKWGNNAGEYIDKLMADLQMPANNGDFVSNFAAKLRGNYARAVIAANISSLAKQTTSYPVALPYLKAGGLVHGLKKLGKTDLKTLEKYSAVYWYRNLGNSTMELSDALQRKSFGDHLPWVFNATQKMDSFTTRRILSACEYRVREDLGLAPGTQNEIDAGTDRYWMEVAKLFNDVVLNTQSNTTVMEKPQITRANAGNISKFFTMFRTDAFQQYNMLVESHGRWNAAKKAYEADSSAENKKALSEARKFHLRTIVGTLTGQMGCVLVSMLLKALRFDDDEFRDKEGDLAWGKIAAYFGSGVVEGYCGFIVGGEILYAGAEYAASKMTGGDAKWWGVEPTGLSTINDTVDALGSLLDALSDGKLWEGKKSFRKTALALSKGFGIPLENMEKYLLMTVRWFAPEWAELHQNFWTEITKSNLSTESRKTIDEAIGVLMDNRAQDLNDTHKQEIARLYLEGGTGAVPSAIPSSVEYTDAEGEKIKVELSGKQQEKYRKIWSDTVSGAIGELLSSDEYEDADDEGKAELIDKLYMYANQIAQHAVVPEKEIEKWVLQGQNAVADGIPLEEYICFRVGLSDITGKDVSGESIDGLKAQRCMEYLETMGWSDSQEKNIYLEVLASESKQKDTNGLITAGLSWNQANDLVSMLGKKWDRMNAIIKSNASEAAKAKALEVYASDAEKKLIRTGHKYGVKLEWYAEVRNNADADGNGTVSQSEAEDFIRSMGLDWTTSAYLWQMITDGKKNPFLEFEGRQFWDDVHEGEETSDSKEETESFFEIDSDSIFG